MERLASRDTCHVSPATAALLVGGYSALEDLGDFTVKAPLRVHGLVGPGKAATRFDVSRSRGLARLVPAAFARSSPPG